MIIFFEPKDTKLDDLADLAMICYAKSKVYFKTAVCTATPQIQETVK